MSVAFKIAPGELVESNGRLYEITQVLDFESVLARDQETGESKRLRIVDLHALATDADVSSGDSPGDLVNVSDEDWQIAKGRLEVIRPLLDIRCTAKMVDARAEVAKVHRATVYRWLDTYQRSGLLSSLLPADRSVSRESRLSGEVEEVIKLVINDYYTKERKPSMKKAYDLVEKKCKNAKLPVPHYNTVRGRLLKIPKGKLAGRDGRKGVQRQQPIRGHNPDPKWPYALVQIDHTPTDIELVDEETRRPIGRAWLTVAIEVYSRMIAGIYLSIDPPGAMSVGMCLIHAMLPKDQWLSQKGVDAQWPIWGAMDSAHADNAQEFRSRTLNRACDQYDVDMQWRPVARPNWGGHIERLLGTFNKEIHDLPGTTMSNPTELGDYDSEKHAAFTLTDLERWLAIYITKIYHRRRHDGIGMSPLKKYEIGVFGDDAIPGRGLPERIVDEERLRIDFLPHYERTVQNYGIALEEVYYYGDVLNRWINATDPKNPKAKRQFTLKRSPRAISPVYFLDPELNEYFAIPYRDSSRPVISVWELRAAKKRLTDQGKEFNEDAIFDAWEELRRIEDEAVTKTKRVRREAQRRQYHAEASKPVARETTAELTPVGALPTTVTPFEDLEEIT